MTREKKVIVNEDAFSFIIGENAIYNLGTGNAYPPPSGLGKAAPKLNGYPSAEDPTQPFERIIEATPYMAFWGVNNTFPQDALEDINKTPHLINALRWKARALYGGGFVYGYAEEDATGNRIIKQVKDPVVKQWMTRSNAPRYFRDIILDYYYFKNIWPQIIMSKDHGKIASINRQQAPHCRLSRQNPANNNLIDSTLINANWKISPADTYNSTIVPNLDMWYNPVERLQEMDGDVFMIPDSDTKMDTVYYSLAEWDSIRQSKWLKLLQAIPEFKAALMKNQTTIKYLIEVPNYFWEYKYPEWKSFSPDKKTELRQKEVSDFDKMMTGSDNAGKSIFTTSYLDERTGILHPGWKITPIADMIKSGIYIEDSQEGATMVYAATGINPTLTGMNPGQGMAAGSGSDEYVAYNNYHSQIIGDEELIVAPFKNLIGPYNGWPDYDYGFKQPLIIALNNSSQTNRPGAKAPNKTTPNNPDTQNQPNNQ